MQFICPFCRGVVAVDDSDCGQDVQCGHCGEVVTASLSRVATNAVIGDFIILEEIGRGGMGVVYLAHQISLDRPAALKVLAEQYARNSEFVVGFIKEARAAAKLNHPHIVQAYAVGEDEGIYYFAMENIDGETMKTVLKRDGKIPVDQALTIIQQIAEALDYAWKEQRLIHRDIKPDNIMLTRAGRAKLADLGLARVAGEIDDTDGDEVMGTPQYISPEHLTGAEMDVRSDIYSLGATLFNLITGRFPFEGRSAGEIARKHLEAPVPNPRSLDPTISHDVAYVVMKMMAKDPDERYQNGEELVEDLRQLRRGKSIAKAKAGVGKQFTVKKGGAGHGKTIRVDARRTQTGIFLPTSTGNIDPRKSSPVLSGSSQNIKITPTESVRRNKEKNAMRQIVTWLAICFLALAAAGGFVFWKIVQDGRAAPITGKPSAETATTTQPKPVAEPTKTPYTDAIWKLNAYIRDNPDKRDDILVKADRVFKEFPQPRYRAELMALEGLLQTIVPMDEAQRVARARERARSRHVAILQQREQEERQRQALIDQERRREELEQERLRLLAEQREREQQWLEQYRAGLQERRDIMRERYIFFGSQQQFESARRAFAAALDEPDKVTDEQLKQDAHDLARWARLMQEQATIAERIWDALGDAGTRIAMQIEVTTADGRTHYGPIVNIAKGRLTMRPGSGGGNITVPLSSLALRQLKRLLREAADKLLGSPDAMFHYLMATGEFADARELVAGVGGDWPKELSATALAYFSGRLKVLAGMSEENRRRELNQMTRKYRGMPEWEQACRAVANP